jgi:hypothetical protein
LSGCDKPVNSSLAQFIVYADWIPHLSVVTLLVKISILVNAQNSALVYAGGEHAAKPEKFPIDLQTNA